MPISSSTRAPRAAGLEVTGALLDSDPHPAALDAARTTGADARVAVSLPHLVEPAVHRDWASRLRKELDLPVLHVVSGTDRVL